MTVAQARAARKSLESSIAARNALQAQYESGARTVADVLEAEKNIFVAKKSLTGAQQQYILNSLRLRVASGTLSPADIAHVDSLFDEPIPTSQEMTPTHTPDTSGDERPDDLNDNAQEIETTASPMT